ncbi:MAG: hypothetical protein ACR2GQ_02460 [Gemmatimonadota bacterium]
MRRAPGVARFVRRLAIGTLVLLVAPASGSAQGHGPLYGLSTPTLGKGGWSVDLPIMGRFVEGGSALMTRPMLSYGVTEDLQASVSLPMPLHRDEGLPPVRGLTRMPMTQDVQVMLGWRFHRDAPAVGSRWESTAWVAFEYPTDARRSGIEPSPGLYGAAVTGYASRSWYFWAGGAYRRYMAPSGPNESRLGDTSMASVVVGYRPPAFRGDDSSADWRGFVELVGERVGRDTALGRTMPDTGSRQVFVGLTALGLYGSWGISGGPAFPLFQSADGDAPRERLRMAANFTFWF